MKNWYKLGLAAFALMALVSVAVGFRNGLNFVDFQWVPARILMDGQSPYSYSLEGLKFDGCQVDANQVPSCLLLLWPFVLLPRMMANTMWDICNLLFVVGFLALTWKLFFERKLGAVLFSFAALVLLTGTPLRVLIGNGQHLMFSLLFFVAAYFFAERDRWLLAGVMLALSAFKYTTIAPLAFVFVAMRWWKPIVIAALLHLVATLFCGWYVDATPVAMVVDSLRVGGMLTAGGDADIASLMYYLGIGNPKMYASIGYAFFAIVLVVLVVRRAKDGLLALAVLAVLSNVMFYHRVYDFVTLVFPLVVVMRDWGAKDIFNVTARILTVVNIGYTFYLDRIFASFGVSGFTVPITFLLEHLLLAALIARSYLSRKAVLTITGKRGRIV